MPSKNLIYRQGFGIALSIFMFLLCLFTLEKTGVPRGYGITLTGICLVVLWGIVTLAAGTTNAFRFFYASKETSSTVNALAMAGNLSFPILIGAGGGLLYINPAMFIAVVVGTTIGVTFSALIIARPFHDTGASDIGDLLNKRYATSLVSRVVSASILLGGIGLGAIGIYFATILLSWFFLLPIQISFCVIATTTILAAILGGANSTTRLSALSAFVLLIAINAPLLILSLNANGFPAGQLTFGVSALSEMWDLEDQLKSLGIPLLENTIANSSPLVNWIGGELIATALVIAPAVAFFPLLTHQYAYSPSSEIASRSATKLILLSAFLGLSLIALLFFNKFNLYQTVLGLSVAEARIAAPFLFSWGDRSYDLITVCGASLNTEASLLTACNAGADHVLSIQDLAINGNLLLAASPDMSGLPFAFTALLTSSIILALIGFSSMILLAMSNSFVSAFFSGVTMRVASSKIFVTRVMVIILGIVTGGMLMIYQLDTLEIFMISMSLIATISAPALLGALWLKQSATGSLLTSISLGLVVLVLYFVLSKYGIDFVPETGDELRIILPGMASMIPSELAAIYSLPVALLVLFGTSFYNDVLQTNRSLKN